MANIVRLTESDLARIVNRVIKEEQINRNNQKHYSQRNLRRLGKTPVVMVESIDVYGPLLSEGVLDSVKDKITSLISKSREFISDKAEELTDNVENFFDKPLSEISFEDVASKLRKITGLDKGFGTVQMESRLGKYNFLFEDEEMSFADKYDRADIGSSNLGEPVEDKSRIGQRLLNGIQTIFGVNALSFGLLGSWLGKILTGAFVAWPVHLLVSVAAIVIITIIRKLMAVGSGNIKEYYMRQKYRTRY
jgi:hypothetical protein